MSNNVVPLFGTKVTPVRKSLDVTELVSSVIDWAVEQGVDVDNDVGFQVRCADFMTYLQLLAREEEQRKTA
jgi:hypothetical protein